MKRLVVAVACAALAGACRAEAPAIEVAAETGTRGRSHVFFVRGKAALADGGKLDVAVYYVRRYPIPENLREPGGPEYDEELIEIDKGVATVAGGEYEAVLAYSDLQPWSGSYRAVAQAGEGSRACDFTVGKPENLAAERAFVDRDIYEEMARLGRLYEAFKARWAALGDAADAGWSDWRREADARVVRIRERNAKRRKAEIYWMECRGRQRVEWLVNRLVPLLDAAQQSATRPRADRPDAAAVAEMAADFEQDYAWYLDFLGIGRIIDAVKVSAALARLQAAEAELDGWQKRLPAEAGEWGKAQGKLRAALLQGQMGLTGELPDAYFGRAERVAKGLTRMMDHLRAVAAGKDPGKGWEDLRKEFREAVETLEASIPKLEND